jgi:hypothetical protein
LRANDYRFKLVADVSTLNVRGADGKTYTVQATHVKISDDGYAFVSFNHQHSPNVGGLVVFKYVVQDGTLETVRVDVSVVTSIRLPRAQINAIDYDKTLNRLYLAGASEEPKFGYKGDSDVAFFMVMQLDAQKKFVNQEPLFYTHLTSFQATSIRKFNNRIYITTGDGTEGTVGGLHIFDANNYSRVGETIEAEHARSVDVDASGIYLYQANHARITRYNLDGTGGTVIYDAVGEAMQRDAKSEILVWNNYLFVSENESGLRMLRKNGEVNVSVPITPRGEVQDIEVEVTNSVTMNSDRKKDASGKYVESNLLLLANGEQGVLWYDVVTDSEGYDRIVAAENNNILGDNSANFIESRGNIVFVADGLGGLKILYIGEDEPEMDCTNAFRGFHTFIKDNGNSKIPPPGLPLDRKVGDVFFEVDSENLYVYLYSVNNLPDDFDFTGYEDDEFTPEPNIKDIVRDLQRSSSIVFGSGLQYFDNLGLLRGGPALTDKNVNNGKMGDYQWTRQGYRKSIPGGVVFTFPKKDKHIWAPAGTDFVIIYSGTSAWGFGSPQGPSGSTGTGVNNNGQIITLGEIAFCVPKE